jgi:hypothetical protein
MRRKSAAVSARRPDSETPADLTAERFAGSHGGSSWAVSELERFPVDSFTQTLQRDNTNSPLPIDGVARIQTGEMLDFGNVRLVGMSQDDFRKAVGLRYADNGQVFILPDDIIQNTVRAFNVSAPSPTGYSALGVPSGRYLAPAKTASRRRPATATAACAAWPSTGRRSSASTSARPSA